MTSTKKDLLSGILYSAISKYLGILISLAIAGILARLLKPDEFGTVAIATVIISFFGIFSDLGIAPAIIQNKNLTEDDLNDIFSFTLWSGLLISILFFFCAWPIAWLYKDSALRTLCQLLSSNLFFASISIVPNALLNKEKKFKFIAYRSFFIQLTGGTIAIAAALSGANIYALIINPILSSILFFIFSFREKPLKIRYTLGIKSLKKIFIFSSYQFMFNLINYFSRNLDKLLIGKYMNLTDLGYYEKSYRLMMLPLQNITFVISPVMHPVLSSFQDNLQKLAYTYEKIVRLLAFIGFPLSVLLWMCSKEIIIILFGSQWMASIPIFKILSISVGIQIILSTSGSIFQAANNTKSLFICGLFSTGLNITGILLGVFVFKSLVAIACCICISYTLCFIQSYLWMYKVTLQRSINYFGKQLVSPLLLTIILIFIMSPVYYITYDSSTLISLLIKSSVFTIVFLLYIQISNTFNIINYLKSKVS